MLYISQISNRCVKYHNPSTTIKSNSKEEKYEKKTSKASFKVLLVPKPSPPANFPIYPITHH